MRNSIHYDPNMDLNQWVFEIVDDSHINLEKSVESFISSLVGFRLRSGMNNTPIHFATPLTSEHSVDERGFVIRKYSYKVPRQNNGIFIFLSDDGRVLKEFCPKDLLTFKPYDWIPVSEAMPEKEDSVDSNGNLKNLLVTCLDKNNEKYVTFAPFDISKQSFLSDDTVTAWAPSPEAFKEN